MKIVQSFWSKPMRGNAGNQKMERLLTSFAYSCLQASQYYSHVELVTDRVGKTLLIDELGLPYTKVTVTLDDLERFEGDLFAVGKIYTYGIQNEPFIHIDGDLFIGNTFEKEIEQSNIVALHAESHPLYTPGYGFTLTEIKQSFSFIPNCLQKVTPFMPFTAVNAAVLGGRNHPFFAVFAEEAFRFIERNPQRTHLRFPYLFNMIFEQLLFYYLLEEKEHLKFCVSESGGLYSFCEGLGASKIIHGRSDQNAFLMEWGLRDAMSIRYPEYLQRIRKLISSFVI